MAVFRAGSIVIGACCVLFGVGAAQGGDDPELRVFFEQLRGRGLFSVAEGYALHRLADPQLNAEIRSDVVIELARTLADHAFLAAGDEQADLFARAEQLLVDELGRSPPPERPALLEAQRTVVLGLRAESRCWPARIFADEASLLQQALETLKPAIDELKRQEARVAAWSIAANRPPRMTPAEVRGWLAEIRWWLARLLLWRAELTAGQNRSSDILDAEAAARRVAGDDDDVSVTARVMQASCQRLRGDPARAAEMLKALEAADPPPSAAAADAIAVERARLALDRQRPDDAVQAAVTYRSRTQRWPGELAWWQLAGLIQLRNIAAERQGADLAQEFQSAGEQLVARADQQLGGVWGQRCRQLWELAENARKFGPELDRLLRAGRSARTAQRWTEAETAYRAALRLARDRANDDARMEAGWGLASVFLQQSRWDDASAEFATLARELKSHSQASSASLMSAYALARRFDQSPTPEHRAALFADLDRHLAAWPSDSTTGEGWLMRARLLEREGRFAEAARSFLKVPVEHPQHEDCIALAARCFLQAVTGNPAEAGVTAEVALSELAEPLAALKSDGPGWTVSQAEFAIQAARLWLAVEPPRYARAAALLATFQEARPVADLTAGQRSRWDLLKAEAVPVQIVALAGEGRGSAAEALATQWDSAPPDKLLTLMKTLVEVRQSVRTELQPRLTSLLLKTIERVADARKTIPPERKREWDLALVDAHLASGQFHRASRVLEDLVRANPQDLELARLAVKLLADVKTPEADAVRELTWSRQEATSKPGSSDWIAARLGRIEAMLDSGQTPEAGKLFKVTALLYRRQSPPELQQKFDALEGRLKAEP